MTIEEIRSLHEARPFVPFNIVVGDGRVYHVPHPEYLAHPRRGRIVVVFDEQGIARHIDLLLVTTLEVPGKLQRRRRRKAG